MITVPAVHRICSPLLYTRKSGSDTQATSIPDIASAFRGLFSESERQEIRD
jgi:hypothetical protein